MMYIHKLHAFIDWAFPSDQIKQDYYLQNYDNLLYGKPSLGQIPVL